jgi:hypothetical protein
MGLKGTELNENKSHEADCAESAFEFFYDRVNGILPRSGRREPERPI